MKILLRSWCLLVSGSLFAIASVEGLKCYECTGEENVKFCNATASIMSCVGQDICISQKTFNEADSRETSTKGCLNSTTCSSQACQELVRENNARCDESRVEGRCTWCCSTDLCNHDASPGPPTTTESEQTTADSLGSNELALPDEGCPTPDELTRRCLLQFRKGVESVMRGEGNSFSNFCRSIPEIFRCFYDATTSCHSDVTSGPSGGSLCPLWDELRAMCPSSCNESAAMSCVLDVFEDILSAFTFQSNAICQQLTSKIGSGYECVSKSVSSCDDGRAIVSKHSLLLSQLESMVIRICPRLPSVNNTDDESSVLVNRVGLSPCQLQEAMNSVSSIGSEIIRTKIEDRSFESICRLLPLNMSFVRYKTESCFLVRRKRALLATEIIDGLLDKACDAGPVNPVRCNTTAARLCVVDLMRLAQGRDVQEACDSVEKTRSCVRWKTEKCTTEEKESLNKTLSHVLLSIVDLCAPHFQCLSNETVTLKEGGQAMVIKVQLTSPPKTICNIPGCQVFLDIIPDNRQAPNCRSRVPISQFLVSSVGGEGGGGGGSMPFDLCSRLVTKANWNEEQSFHLAAKADFKYDNSQMRSVQIAMRKVVNGSLVERRTLCQHKVLVIDGDQPSTCHSVTDPHIKTFDGRAYNNFLEGFFTLYRHRSFPYEVQVAFQRCVDGGATCNCAVSVRAGDSVFFVDKCRTKESPSGVRVGAGSPCQSNRVECTQFTKTEMFYHDKITPGFRVFNRGDFAFEVLLPHGTRVIIRGERWFNVYIHPSPFDWNSTEGLCGTYDGRPRNDLSLRSGRLWRESLAHRAEPPLDFSLDWRVPENQLLMQGVAKTPFRLPVHCDCETSTSPDGALKSFCSSSRILELCDFKTDGEITYKLPKGHQPIVDREVSSRPIPPNRKRKRETSNERRDDATSGALGVYDFDLNPDLAEVTQTGNWTKSSALDFCRKSLLDDSKAIKNCLIHLENFDPEFGLESCVEDLMYSGGSEFVDGSAEVLRSACAEQLAANVSLYNSMDGGDTLLEVEESLCVDECSPRGICLRGRCFCEEGYAGSDCGISLGEPPQSVALLNGGLCDRGRTNCSWSVVLGQTFVDTKNLSCRLQEVELLDNETRAAAEGVVTIGATYISRQQVLCAIPDGPSSLLISVSNDGATFSEQHLFLSRDVACYDCAWNASNHAVCRRKTNTCLVSGTCYTSGEESSDDPCLVCDPLESSAQLHRRTSTTCTNRTALTVAIVVLAILFCVLVVLMVFRLKRKEKRSVSQSPRIASSSRDVEKVPHTHPQSHDNVAMEEIPE